MGYAIISLGGKQYRVSEGERLLVDRLPTAEGETFTPRVLLAGGGDEKAQLAPDGVTVTARVVGHVLGEKIRIGKYRPKSGYRRHTGHRSRLSQIQIETIGQETRKTAAASKAQAPQSPVADDTAQVEAPPEYEGLKVAEVAAWAKGRHLPTLEKALAYERATAGRKGAIATLEAAIAAREEDR